MMSEKQVIVTLEDGFGRVQTSIATSLSAPQLMDKIMEIDEQQATIRRLQDLCGKSDGENAKLRIENKKLQEENEQLQAQLREKEEDERLYANEIVKLNKEAKEVLDFKSLGGDY
jgi:septal ring factor EnvC (AmiA/AmiB activator)